MVISFPRLNPVTFKKEITSPYEKCTEKFIQEFDVEDYIVFQLSYDNDFLTNEIKAYIVDCSGEIILEVGKTTVIINSLMRQDVFRIPCSVIKEGIYNILIESPAKFRYYSNTFYIHDANESLLIQYGCKDNKFDCLFKTINGAEYFYLRIAGGVKTQGYSFKSDDVEFIDQDRKITLIDSIPYTIRKYTFGESIGMPIWLADKLNRIFSCDDVKINGVKVVKSSGAALELSSQENYKYVGATIDLLHADEGYSEKPDTISGIHVEEFTEIFN